LDRDGRGTVVFSVTNDVQRTLSVRCEVLPEGRTQAEWLRIRGSESVSLDAGETTQVVVEVQAPVGTEGGSYAFRLKAYDTEHPDENYTEGQSASFATNGIDSGPPPNPPIWIFVVLLVVLLAVGGGVTAWVLLSGDKTVAVPNVVGLSIDDVQAEPPADFTIVVRDEESAEHTPGTILSQDPDSNAAVEKGTELELAVAVAPTVVPIRSFVGGPVDDARAWAEAHGVHLVVSKVESDESVDTVLSQDPSQGDLPVGDGLQVEVAIPRSEVNVVDYTFSQIGLLERWAEQHGVLIEKVERESEERAGTVVLQEPDRGLVPKGDTIRAEVAIPWKPVPLEDFRGKALAELQAWADAHGVPLKVGRKESEEPEKTILDQRPSSGEIDRGQPIRVTIAVPPTAFPVVSFVSAPYRDLRDWIARHGLKLKTSKRESDEADGTVLEQSPSTGRIHKGDTVKVVISVPARGEPVEDFQGRDAELLTRWAADRGIRIERKERKSDRPKGTILEQDPNRGRIKKGDVIQIVVATPRRLPDLYVRDFTMSPSTPTQGKPVQLQVVVYNRGTAPSGAFTVQWWAGENFSSPAKAWRLDSLAAKGGRVLTYTYSGYKSWYGKLTTKVVVDALREVQESNESNNDLRRQIRVKKSGP
jgi:beta-lactam-binding protein with PASTA domain